MACQTILDAEGEIIDRIRALPGADEIPICGVLDLHGNISQSCIEQTQGLVAYRDEYFAPPDTAGQGPDRTDLGTAAASTVSDTTLVSLDRRGREND